MLRERLRQIQKELGETDGTRAELAEDLKKAIAAAGMPPEAEEQALRELARLERMPDSAAEYSMTRNYLDWLIAMPWSRLDRGTGRHRAGPRDSRRGSLRARQGQAPHPRIPCRAQAQSAGPQPHSLLRRPSRGRQDLAGTEHRQGAGAQV